MYFSEYGIAFYGIYGKTFELYCILNAFLLPTLYLFIFVCLTFCLLGFTLIDVVIFFLYISNVEILYS